MAALSDRLDEALHQALDWLEARPGPPALVARPAGGTGGAPVTCEAPPYAVAHVAAAWHRASSVRAVPAAVPDWLTASCDPDGWVRFYGPAAPGVIGPDVDDTALVWAQRRALAGEEPPPAVLDGILGCRGPAGAFATWPDPPADGPRVEVDPVVNANVLGLLGALGRRDASAEAAVVEALEAVNEGREPGGHWYPDPAALLLAAQRATRLGALSSCHPRTRPTRAGSLLMQLARRTPEDVEAVLAARDEDGVWPWTAAFIGGEHNAFPGGEVLARPEFGSRALTTALVVEALADEAGWPDAGLARSRGAVAAAARLSPAWTHAAGRLAQGVTLVRRDVAGTAQPVLVSSDGELPLEIAPRSAADRHYSANELWAVSYRGTRGPSPAEHAAIEVLLEQLGTVATGAEPPSGIARRGTFRCSQLDASDVPAWLAGAALEPGQEVTIELPAALDAARALPSLAAALDLAERGGIALRYQHLPFCALPWPDGRVVADDDPGPLVEPCDRCVEPGRCPGPSAGLAARPIPRDSPWPSLRRFAEDWQQRTGHPGPKWPDVLERLEDLPAGALTGTRWSVTVALDVSAGSLDPTFRVAAFYGRAGERPPGSRVVERMGPGWARVAPLVAEVAQTLPVYPALSEGPDGSGHSLYVDTTGLSSDDAWAVATTVGLAAGSPIVVPGRQSAAAAPALLGVSVAVDSAGQLRFDVYARWRAEATGPWTPPPDVLELAGPGDLLATLRAPDGGRLVVRKWDVPWWSTGRRDDELLGVLGADEEAAASMTALLGSERFTLHPTTLAWRPDGRRIYLRVR